MGAPLRLVGQAGSDGSARLDVAVTPAGEAARLELLLDLVRQGARLDGLDHCLLRGDGFELAVTEHEAELLRDAERGAGQAIAELIVVVAVAIVGAVLVYMLLYGVTL